MLEDGAWASGSVTSVQRVGDTVRRPLGRWSSVVHPLLRHLQEVGFAGAPRFLGVDESGYEVLSLLPGEVALRPWPDVLRDDAGVVAVAGWLRDYHTAVADFRPPADAEWFVPDVRWEPGQIVRHGDLGLWNSVWRDSQLVGFIDWDFAEPGPAIDDVAQLAWYAVPLRDKPRQQDCGFLTGAPVRRRLELLCTTYGVDPDEVVTAVVSLQERECARLRRWGAEKVEPWSTFLDRGDVESIEEDRSWLLRNGPALTPKA
jgi:hypothetical protein